MWTLFEVIGFRKALINYKYVRRFGDIDARKGVAILPAKTKSLQVYA